MKFKTIFEGSVLPVDFGAKRIRRVDPADDWHSARRSDDGTYQVLSSGSGPRDLTHHPDATHALYRNPNSEQFVAYRKADKPDHFTGSDLIGDLHEPDVHSSKVRF